MHRAASEREPASEGVLGKDDAPLQAALEAFDAAHSLHRSGAIAAATPSAPPASEKPLGAKDDARAPPQADAAELGAAPKAVRNGSIAAAAKTSEPPASDSKPEAQGAELSLQAEVPDIFCATRSGPMEATAAAASATEAASESHCDAADLPGVDAGAGPIIGGARARPATREPMLRALPSCASPSATSSGRGSRGNERDDDGGRRGGARAPMEPGAAPRLALLGLRPRSSLPAASTLRSGEVLVLRLRCRASGASALSSPQQSLAGMGAGDCGAAGARTSRNDGSDLRLPVMLRALAEPSASAAAKAVDSPRTGAGC